MARRSQVTPARKTIKLPGLNVAEPWAELLFSKRKVVETRTYPIPARFLNSPIMIVETPKKKGGEKARIIGAIEFKECKFYETELAFRKDELLHLVQAGDIYDWKKEKPKWGWAVWRVWRFNESSVAPPRRGYVWTGPLEIAVDHLPAALLKLLSSRKQPGSARQ
jgi:hypothetical protein